MNYIRRILAVGVALMLLVSIGAASAESIRIETARFSSGDMNINYIYAGAAKADAMAVFGEPAGSSTDVSEATGDATETWYYEGLELLFDDMGTVCGAKVKDSTYAGPRGLKIGMSADQVAALFYTDPAAEEGVLYFAKYIEAIEAYLPPFGLIYDSDDGTFIYIYYAPMQAYGEEVLGDPTNYLFEETAQLTIYFDAEETVIGFNWRVSALAE